MKFNKVSNLLFLEYLLYKKFVKLSTFSIGILSIRLLYSIGNISFSLQSIYSKTNWISSSLFNKIELFPF